MFDDFEFRFALHNASNVVRSALYNRGVTVEVGCDFQAVEGRLPVSKSGLTPHFTPNFQEFGEGERFYFVLRPIGSRKVVGFVAVQFVELAGKSLLDYLKHSWARLYCDEEGKRIEFAGTQPELLAQVSGKVAYLGDLWILEGYRKQGFARYLVVLAQLMTYDLQGVDWVFSWMHRAHFFAGNAARWGFSHAHPEGLRFVRPPRQFSKGLVFVANSKPELMDLIRQYSSRENAA
ncbi:hypothetical protein [Pseudovibrio sp. WM33]|uniref:hypothetical protein n=1 Tax=Pseudovibrio sp. WM33 TaxID=1735585 RepID=UPI0007B22430|nr:hypothetical protein [Pseudovibrio sp. WM33]KZL26067.1 hypothetical protein PsWM33_01592 [Pseudovibrio sp. WM33]